VRTPLITRFGLLALGALVLAACDIGLVLAPNPAAPGATVTVSNADGPHCTQEASDGGTEPADGLPVDLIMITNIVDLIEGPDINVVASTVTDANGLFQTTITAPDLPGSHILLAVCGGIGDIQDAEVRAAAVDDPVDEDGVIVDLVNVTQAPLSVSVDKAEVEPGDDVVATFNRCQDENDLGIFELEGLPAAVDTDDPAMDFPDLDVYVDDELVETIAGDERYPTGTVDVPLTLAELGSHEIKGICTYQTFDIDLEVLLDELGEPVSLSPTAIDYPLVDGPFTLDEATTQASATVVVVAAAVDSTGTGAQPVEAQPSYTG
jgi:hypothetical protein